MYLCYYVCYDLILYNLKFQYALRIKYSCTPQVSNENCPVNIVLSVKNYYKL